MPYIVDGHNLIGAMREIHLEDPDDEALLISRLRRFCARTRRGVTVYFDRGAPTRHAPRDAGGLSIRFVRPPRSADQAIMQHLSRLKGTARNWTVVSSDQEVQTSARRAGARVLSSDAFALLLTRSIGAPGRGEKPESEMAEEELSEWMRLFHRPRPPE